MIGAGLFWPRFRSPRPKLKKKGLGAFRRMAQASRTPDDLHILYARIKNAKDGGGDRGTLTNAGLWMEAVEIDTKKRVASADGNWLDLSTGKPQPVSTKKLTIRPGPTEYGIEIAGKFDWAEEAWLAGEHNPSLKPGVYKISAKIGSGEVKPQVFEWRVVNPGKDSTLSVEGGPDVQSYQPDWHPPTSQEPSTTSALLSASSASASPDPTDLSPRPDEIATALLQECETLIAAAWGEGDEPSTKPGSGDAAGANAFFKKSSADSCEVLRRADESVPQSA